MMPCRSAYNLGDRRLIVETTNSALAEQFANSYSELSDVDREVGTSSGVDSAPFHLTIEHGALPTASAAAVLTFEGPVMPGGDCQLFIDGERTLLLFPGRGAMHADHHAMRAHVIFHPGEERSLGTTLGIAAIEAAAFAGGQSMIHAAALTLPEDSRMILLHAPSGVGKTTTALALVAGGFALESDDVAFIHSDGVVKAWGMPRDLKVHRKSVAMMPWVQPLLTGPWTDEGERRLPREKLNPFRRRGQHMPRPVAALFRLSRVGSRSEIRVSDRAQMLASLAADNVRSSRYGLLPIQAHRFQMLAQMSTSVPVYDLCIGKDLHRIPGLVDDCVRNEPSRTGDAHLLQLPEHMPANS
jgi:hypothetical protein